MAVSSVGAFNSRCPVHRRKCKCSLAVGRNGQLSSLSYRPKQRAYRAHSQTKSSAIHDEEGVVIVFQDETWQHEQNPPLLSAPSASAWRSDHGHAIQYYKTCAASDIRAFLPSAFWEDVVVRACYANQTVRCAVVAVSEAHQAYCSNATSDHAAITAYGIALGTLRAYLRKSPQSKAIVLICCILIFAAERMLGNNELSYTHLRAGMAILKSQTQDKAVVDDEEAAYLEPILMVMIRLDTESALLFSHRLVLSKIPAVGDHASASLRHRHCPPPEFGSLQEAAANFGIIRHHLWRFIRQCSEYNGTDPFEVPRHVFSRKESLTQQLTSWKLALDRYEWTRTRRSTEEPSQILSIRERIVEQLGLLVLKAQHLVNSWNLAETVDNNQQPRPFDRNPLKLIECGQRALYLRESLQALQGEQLKKSFSIHLGLPETLLILSHRTSYPAVRMQALDILQGWRSLEGRSKILVSKQIGLSVGDPSMAAWLGARLLFDALVHSYGYSMLEAQSETGGYRVASAQDQSRYLAPHCGRYDCAVLFTCLFCAT